MKKFFAGAVALVLGIGGATALAVAPASAHNSTTSVTCEAASVHLTNYDGPATVKVTLDGVVVHDTAPFGGVFHYTQPLTHDATTPTHTLVTEVLSGDPGYSFTHTDVSPSDCYTPPPPTDECPNLDGIQETIPDGYILQEGNCVLPPPPVDVCPNLDGAQEIVPEGYILENGTCVIPPPPVTNTVCEVNTAGTRSTDLNDQWGNVDTRTKGHVEYVNDALHVWTEDSSGQSKVSEGIAVNFPLSETGQLAIDATANAGNVYPYGPGLNLFVDINGDLVADGTLVYETVYGQDLWVTNGSAQALKDASVHTGGNGSENHGTINQFLLTFPNATVVGLAYSLGSGVQGDWNINSITANCKIHTFDRVDRPVLQEVDPVITVGEWSEGEPTCDNPDTEGNEFIAIQTRQRWSTVTPNKLIVVEGTYQIVPDVENAVTTELEAETRTLTYEGDDCDEVVVPPTEEPTPPVTVVSTPDGLAETGTNVGIISLAGLALFLAGLVAFATARISRKSREIEADNAGK